MQPVRIVQLDRASGTATASLHGMLKGISVADGGAPPVVEVRVAPPPEETPVPVAPAAPPRKLTAGERARRQQEEILRRMRGEDA